MADEFALTHKNVFTSNAPSSPVQTGRTMKSPKSFRGNPTPASANRSLDCHYCHEHGHFIASCPVLKRKEQPSTVKPSPVSLIQTTSLSLHRA